MERSKTIFGNDIAARDYRKAVRQKPGVYINGVKKLFIK